MRDRPLSDAQERNLIALGEHTTEPWYSVVAQFPEGVKPSGWLGAGYKGTRSNTLQSLERLGLAISRMDYPRLTLRYQITEAGIAMLDSMGD